MDEGPAQPDRCAEAVSNTMSPAEPTCPIGYHDSEAQVVQAQVDAAESWLSGTQAPSGVVVPEGPEPLSLSDARGGEAVSGLVLGKWHEKHQAQPSKHAENEEEVQTCTILMNFRSRTQWEGPYE